MYCAWGRGNHGFAAAAGDSRSGDAGGDVFLYQWARAVAARAGVFILFVAVSLYEIHN